jgi:DNA-directed RNA polymerase subunit K/omega
MSYQLTAHAIERARTLAEQAPPLTPEQSARLSTLLGGVSR